MNDGKPAVPMKVLLVLIGIVLLVAGPAALLAPESAAGAFGIPADSHGARSYLIAAGVRDAALGVWLLGLLAIGAGRRTLAVSVLSIAVVAAGDAANVRLNAGEEGAQALVVHIAGLVALLVLAWLLWRPEARFE